MIGRALGHYRILEKIGAGGMGEVYLAEDRRLERRVAIKVLRLGALADEAARRQFRREALALSRLNHPNIETVHEFANHEGLDYLVMEYIVGTTLADRVAQGPLGDKEVLRFGLQLADALAAAHEQGVVHCDLKPGNLRVTPDGRLKVLDFGLATLRRHQTTVRSATTQSLAELPEVAGTLPYMAPEQLRGETVDHRTDIWAAGVVLYELTTGRRPFENKVATALAADIQTAPIVPPSQSAGVSTSVEPIVLKCLERDPDLRYQSARDLGADFRRLLSGGSGTGVTATGRDRRGTVEPAATRKRVRIPAIAIAAAVTGALAAGATLVVPRLRSQPPAVGAAAIDSLAVLPLANLAGHSDQAYVVEGMHDALITELSKIRALRVISRSSAVRFKGTEKPLGQIARELDVDALVEGSVLRSGDRLRVTAQLIQVDPERHVWAESFDREMTDVLYLTSEVAQAVARQVRIALSPSEQAQLARARRVNARAYEFYALGRHHWTLRTLEGYRQAINTFEKALDLDPEYAPAYAALADSYKLLGEQGGLPPDTARSQADAAIRKALRLDPDLAEAHTSRAEWTFFYEWNWAEAERSFQRAIELKPGYATAHQLYGRCLAFLGRFDQALAELERARQLDPLSIILHAYTGQVHLFAREYDRAAERLAFAAQLNPNHALVRHNLGELFLAQGRYADAVEELTRSNALSTQPSTHYLAILAAAYARGGRVADARVILKELALQSKQDLVSPFDLAVVHTALGERDQALTWLERGFEKRDGWMVELKAWPWFDSLAGDPRFEAVLRGMNFPR